MLALTAAIFGEFRGFHIQAVSRGACTYAYVNPVVAVIVGYFLGGETVGPRTLLGTLLVLVSVVVITTTRAKKPAAPPLVKPLQELAEE